MALEFLPRDVIYDILLRLDIKSLCRSRCVSKWLKILISNASFVHEHEQRFIGKIHLFYFCRGRKQVAKTKGALDGISLEKIRERDKNNEPFLFETCGRNGYEDVRISFRDQPLIRSLGPLNLEGLLFFDFKRLKFLASCRGLIFVVDGDGDSYFIKPMSHRMYKLQKKIYGESDASYGFGYSNSRMEYKVVRLCPTQDGWDCDVLELKELHLPRNNFGNNSGWKKLHEDRILPQVQGKGVFAGCNLFWMNKKSDGLIMSFNVDNNEVSYIDYPSLDNPKPLSNNLGLIDVNGELGMFRVWKNNTDQWALDIWMLKERKMAVWVKEYSIILEGCGNWVTPLYFCGEEDMIIVQHCGKIYMQDKRGERFPKLKIKFSGSCCAYWENLAVL